MAAHRLQSTVPPKWIWSQVLERLLKRNGSLVAEIGFGHNTGSESVCGEFFMI